MRDGKLNDPNFGTRFSGTGELAAAIHRLFMLSCKKYGLNDKKIILRKDLFRKENSQIEMF